VYNLNAFKVCIIILTTNKTASFYLENLCTLLNFNSTLIFIRQHNTSRLKLNKSATFFFTETLLLLLGYLIPSDIRVIESSLHFKIHVLDMNNTNI
jgi:hypothetical protein